MESKDVKRMFNIIIDICERTFFLNQQLQQQLQSQLTEIFDEKIYQLPSFIESLSCVCNQIDDTLPEGSINTLEKLILLAIDSYPKLIKRYNHQISLAIAQLFISIQLGKAAFYIEFISRVVYQSMIRIFSYKTNYFSQVEKMGNGKQLDEDPNVNLDVEETNKSFYNITSTDYVQFWSNLLNLAEFKELNAIGVHINDRKKLVGIIYDEYIETIMKIIKKLDLSAVKSDVESEKDSAASSSQQSSQSELMASSNPIAGLRPLKPRDQEILVNLVDFSK
jgi:DNA-dependent protein kinase catalytic subunit